MILINPVKLVISLFTGLLFRGDNLYIGDVTKKQIKTYSLHSNVCEQVLTPV